MPVICKKSLGVLIDEARPFRGISNGHILTRSLTLAQALARPEVFGPNPGRKEIMMPEPHLC